MIRESFLETITGHFLDGQPVENFSIEDSYQKSVADHICRLFNTREGSLSHLPDYGIPDVAELYRGLPKSFEKLRSTILILLKKYEPRLQRVQVTLQPFNPVEMKVSFELSGYLASGSRLVIKTDFSSTGQVGVAKIKKGF